MSSQRIALVTGTSGELGAAIAMRLASEGYDIAGLDLRAPPVAGSWRHYSCDLSDLAAVSTTLEQIRRELGPLRLLVNNAAYYNPVSLWELSPEQIQRTMAVNVTAVMYLCQQVAKQMKDTGGGNIVNIASIAGRSGSSQIDYGASKAAVINMTATLGRLLAEHNIRINAVAPALIDAGMGKVLPAAVKEKYLQNTPLRRAAHPREIANVVAFLSSDEASYVTGSTVDVNGGL
ncbi:MAG TPA: SDR family NAD(P)-dependent oxidoreductase [Steroidobacter sp.]|uniref:SDR family NAD(P)-dependent oxidoreductase n=1 Tax=Steroidobacter sp. TaxID=1978227 RepID=UPI002ED97A23